MKRTSASLSLEVTTVSCVTHASNTIQYQSTALGKVFKVHPCTGRQYRRYTLVLAGSTEGTFWYWQQYRRYTLVLLPAPTHRNFWHCSSFNSDALHLAPGCLSLQVLLPQRSAVVPQVQVHSVARRSVQSHRRHCYIASRGEPQAHATCEKRCGRCCLTDFARH